MTARRVRTPRGVLVTFPGGRQAEVFTDTTADADAIRKLLQDTDCEPSLFECPCPTTTRNGAFSR